ncbi:YraN family protein [Patescibacteria group bacterium]|nr:YraN family protein [Patescibacteria group bacterium]
MNKRDVGRLAERSAVIYLKSRGYKILHTNWTCYAGEIDIVAYKERLIFVEVKSAFSGFCSPCEMFNYRKKKNLLRTIQKFLSDTYSNLEYFPEWQLDLICVSKYGSRIRFEHYPNTI